MRKWILIVVGTLGVAVVLAMASVLRDHPVDGDPFDTPAAAADDLESVATTRVFFAHQSVGFNIMDALPAVFDELQVPLPPVVESQDAPADPGFVHARIGTNGDPLGKIAHFDKLMRGGMADAVDVALLKLCYVDFRQGTDVDEIFTAYRDTFAALARDYPDTAFVAATSPLTTERGPRGKVKAVLGRGDRLGPEHNVVREQFNALMRAEYAEPGSLFDIAAVQSTTRAGDRVAYERDGEVYYAMDKEYASDPGHLNASGGAIAASAFLAVLADAVA